MLVPTVGLDVVLQHGDAQLSCRDELLLDDVGVTVVPEPGLGTNHVDVVRCDLSEGLCRMRATFSSRPGVPNGQGDMNPSSESQRYALCALRLEPLSPCMPPAPLAP